MISRNYAFRCTVRCSQLLVEESIPRVQCNDTYNGNSQNLICKVTYLIDFSI